MSHEFFDTRKLPLCPQCNRKMRLDTYDRRLNVNGLSELERIEVYAFEAPMFQCNFCGCHMLFCMNGRAYLFYDKRWNFHEEDERVKIKVLFT